VKFGKKNSIKLKIDGVDVKTILNEILKVPVCLPCALRNDVMMRWASPHTFTAWNHYILNFYVTFTCPACSKSGLIQPLTPVVAISQTASW